MDEEMEEEYSVLCTRRNTYQIKQENKQMTTSSAKKDIRYQYHLKCMEHQSVKIWSKVNDDCGKCVVFEPAPLPNGKLPTLHSVLCYYFYLRAESDYVQKSVNLDVAIDLMIHWIKYDVYTKTRINIKLQLEGELKTYKYLKDYPQKKKKETYWQKYDSFLLKCKELFDIIGDTDRIKRQEEVWNVKMTDGDRHFYNNMKKVPQTGYCSNVVDRKWKKTDTRKRKTDEQLEKRRAEAIQYDESAIHIT